MHSDECCGVIYISNKSKYLKTEMRYAKAVKNNLYNFKSSFKWEDFLQTYFIYPLMRVYIYSGEWHVPRQHISHFKYESLVSDVIYVCTRVHGSCVKCNVYACMYPHV